VETGKKLEIVMAVKLIDLQLIYGLGAREKFEDLAFDLIKGEEPRALKVRVSQGDGGIDAHVNDLSDPGGVHVYQCKFFPRALEDAQKTQIRESFKRCRESTDYRLKRWTLCLPIDLSVPERQWFESWRDSQQASGIAIDDPWGASILENMLHQDKSKGLRDVYFKEESIAQIGDMHGVVHRLDARVEEVLREREGERSRAKQSGEFEVQRRYVDQMLSSLRDEFLPFVQERFPQPEKQPAVWEVVIHPSWVSTHARITSLLGCWSALQTCQVGPVGLAYPSVTDVRRTSGPDWVAGIYANEREVECYRFSQRCVFVHAHTILEDMGSPPWTTVYAGDAVFRLTQMFRFAKGLAEKVFDPGDGAVEMRILLSGIRGRVLAVPGIFLRTIPESGQSELLFDQHCKRDELLADPDALAVKAAAWFFERFNWLHVDAEYLKNLQKQYLPHL
jgi:hypothetical protein